MSRHASKESLAGSIKDALDHVKGMLPGSKGADFNDFQDGVEKLKASEVDAFIKERIRIYLQSWVIPPLERAYEKSTRGSMERKVAYLKERIQYFKSIHNKVMSKRYAEMLRELTKEGEKEHE